MRTSGCAFARFDLRAYQQWDKDYQQNQLFAGEQITTRSRKAKQSLGEALDIFFRPRSAPRDCDGNSRRKAIAMPMLVLAQRRL
jgi:hypothetical protein